MPGPGEQRRLRVLVAGGRLCLTMVGPTPCVFRAMEAVLAECLGPDASTFIDTMFSIDDPDQVRSTLDRAKFADIEIDHRPLQLWAGPAAHFVWQYVTGTPLAAKAKSIDEDRRFALERSVAERCEPFTDRGSLVMTPIVLVATGSRG